MRHPPDYARVTGPIPTPVRLPNGPSESVAVFPFSCCDTPTSRATVERDLARIARRLAEEDPGILSLLLTGGFARGEGSFLEERPLNDYDIIAIRSATPPPPGSYESLSREFARDCAIPVDLKPVWVHRLPFVGRKIFWYEARAGGRTIWGPDLRKRIRPMRSSQIDLTEVLRLLQNRAAGLVESVTPDTHLDVDAVTLQARKAQLACGDALLLLRGSYHWSLAERARRLTNLPVSPRERGIAMRAVEAARWKLDPSGFTLATAAQGERPSARATGPAGALWESAKQDLLAVVDMASEVAPMPRDRLLEHAIVALRVGRFRRAPGTPQAWKAGVAILRDCENARPKPAAGFREARSLLGEFGPVYDADDFVVLRDRLFAARGVTFP
ncbi:MAG: hypothetical protein ACYDDF_11795 [Thermoplasmatota archaeon]